MTTRLKVCVIKSWVCSACSITPSLRPVHMIHSIYLINVSRNLGRLYPGDVTFVLDGTPGDIRKMVEPDVAFVSIENVKPSKGFIYRAPDLAIEIKSPSQNDEEMRDKAAEYIQYGTKQVW